MTNLDFLGAIARISQTGEVCTIIALPRETNTGRQKARLEGKHRSYFMDDLEPVPVTKPRVEMLWKQNMLQVPYSFRGDGSVVIDGHTAYYMHEAQIILRSTAYKERGSNVGVLSVLQSTLGFLLDAPAEAVDADEDEEPAIHDEGYQEPEPLTPEQLEAAQQTSDVPYWDILTGNDVATLLTGRVQKIRIRALSKEVHERFVESRPEEPVSIAGTEVVGLYKDGQLVGFTAPEISQSLGIEVDDFQEEPEAGVKYLHTENHTVRAFIEGVLTPGIVPVPSEGEFEKTPEGVDLAIMCDPRHIESIINVMQEHKVAERELNSVGILYRIEPNKFSPKWQRRYFIGVNTVPA